jgi:hypothetical protein
LTEALEAAATQPIRLKLKLPEPAPWSETNS